MEPHESRVKTQRMRLLNHITAMTDKVMVGLAMIWIGLMIGDFVGKLTPPLVVLNYVIWAIFGVDFAIKFWVAPHKLRFLREHWITVISLVLPAFRVLRILQALSMIRAISLVRILTSVNLSMGALSSAMGKKGLGYVTLVTIIVLFGGAAGMYKFEQPAQLIQDGFAGVAKAGGGLHSYSDAVWWTAMLMTTIGSQYWPVTAAGRALCFLLSMYSLGVFGYITAALASFFVGQDKKHKKKSGTERDQLEALHKDLRAMRAELAEINRKVEG